MSNELKVPSKCKECGGTSLTWDHVINTTSGVQDGLLKANEMRCQFFLGCDECSATLAIVSADKVAAYLDTPPQPDHSAQLAWSVSVRETGERTGVASIRGPGVFCMEVPVEYSLLDFMKALEAQPLDTAQGDAQAVAYADPKAFENFGNLAHLGGLYAKEWMWASAAPGLIPLYTHADAGERAPECFCVEHGLHIEQLQQRLATAEQLLRSFRHGPGPTRSEVDAFLSASPEPKP